MISRFIFVVPKPGMKETDFFRYWKTIHAPLGAKIPQVLGYRICCRQVVSEIPATHPYWGAAEVWLRDGEAALAMAKSKEYIDGARVDEPNWLAFWAMMALDTQAHVLSGGLAEASNPGSVKILALVKRKPGMPLSAFRDYSLSVHGQLDLSLPGLRRYIQGHVLDGWYEVGEPPFDCVSQLWFDNLAAVGSALRSNQNRRSSEDLASFVDSEHAHAIVVDESWVVGPQFRKN
jgi:uncharacterized protein (TIGR02118 family)